LRRPCALRPQVGRDLLSRLRAGRSLPSKLDLRARCRSPPCVLHFTRPSARGYRPGTGVRLATVRLSRRDAVSQPAPGCHKPSTRKDAGRAENLRTAVFTSPARADAKMEGRGRVLKSSRFAGRPRTGPAPGG
jgi:hypothetical protein